MISTNKPIEVLTKHLSEYLKKNGLTKGGNICDVITHNIIWAN